jgi:MinD-like ATPase involved in chromosome partitioning or flagellar assembly
MPDQAAQLRDLIKAAAPSSPVETGQLPMVVVAGSRPGVGATTTAVNLAAVLADRGERVVLIDGAEARSNVLAAIDVHGESSFSLTDVLLGTCNARDAIITGPAGLNIVPGLRRSPTTSGARRESAVDPLGSRHLQQRLFAELQSLAQAFDVIVIDAGSGLTRWTRRFWQQARLVALVSTTDDAALLEAYAAIKLSACGATRPRIRLLMNQVDNDRAADAAHCRFDNACRRFLSLSIPALPSLPCGAYDASAGMGRTPRVWQIPNSPFGHAALWLGRAVSDILSANETEMQAVQDGCATDDFPAPSIPHHAPSFAPVLTG